MNFGFIIDNRTCIGCHACSVACKQENEVPLGVHRTWVKVVDRGLFPNTGRHFQVTRCNHCANPPCVRICPVTAMYKRADGIVDFDPDACIGCKACLQACPYDAIHIDPNSGTAAKCHYCAHKVESGLEPACVAVCPEHSIISGDLDDPNSEISRMLNEHPVSVRRPEQGTAPKLFYIDGDSVTLTPGAAASGSLAWSDGAEQRAQVSPGHQGLGSAYGPVFLGGPTMAEHMVQTTYTVGHKVPWHWPVPAYLVTKAIAAGLPIAWALVLTLSGSWRWRTLGVNRLMEGAAFLIALVFLAITTGLLILDLERPERFLRIITRPQWGSWLTRGAFILMALGAVFGAYLAASWFGWPSGLSTMFLVVAVPLGVAAAAYTGFLFAQAEGRDLWQSPLAPFHLVVQAVLAGVGILLVLTFGSEFLYDNVIEVASAVHDSYPEWPAGFAPTGAGDTALILFALFLVADALCIAFELLTPHASATAAQAAHEIVHGRYRDHLRWALWLGRGAPLFFAMWVAVERGLFGGERSASTGFDAIVAGVLVSLALIGLYLYEHAFVMAPQEIPNS